MQGFTIIDGVVAAVILLSAILAYSRGLVREMMAIAGWVVAAIVAYAFAPQAEPLVREIPLVGNMLKGSCELSIVAAFSAVFALALIAMGFFTPLLSSLIHRSALGGVDQGLGFLFGAARGVILVAVAFIAYQSTMANETIAMVAQSRSITAFAPVEAALVKAVPQDATGWVVKRYEALAGNCGAAADGSTAAPGQSAAAGTGSLSVPSAPATPAAAPAGGGSAGGSTGN